MRFLHTADWHLGRLFHGVHLTEDQAHVLDQLVDVVKQAGLDAVLIAGDIYDRSFPPPEAVDLLDDVICRLVLDAQVPVVLIAGNHDSAQRMHFAARLLDGQRLHIRGKLEQALQPVPFKDDHGLVHVFPLPYAEPALVREHLGGDEIHTHAEAMGRIAERIKAKNGTTRSVLVGHAFVTGGKVSESERPLSVGGSGEVPGECLDGFNYVALGHLHFPHSVYRENVRYAGSLMKYSFSEADHHKAVSIVEMDRVGACKVEQVKLRPRHDVRRIQGQLKELLDGPAPGTDPNDYLEITLLDQDAIYDAMGKLRQVYPNVLHIQRSILEATGELQAGRTDHRKMSEKDLFGSFFNEVTGEPLSGGQTAAFVSVVEELHRTEREAGE